MYSQIPHMMMMLFPYSSYPMRCPYMSVLYHSPRAPLCIANNNNVHQLPHRRPSCLIALPGRLQH